jgi:putative component of toxin-antitoxin plasmid stabilization module
VLMRLESGNSSNVKSVSGGVYILKIDFDPSYKVYFGYDGPKVVILLAGGIKNARIKILRRRKRDEMITRNEKNGNIENKDLKMPPRTHYICKRTSNPKLHKQL